MAAQPGLCRTGSKTPKTAFLRTRLISDMCVIVNFSQMQEIFHAFTPNYIFDVQFRFFVTTHSVIHVCLSELLSYVFYLFFPIIFSRLSAAPNQQTEIAILLDLDDRERLIIAKCFASINCVWRDGS